MNNLPYTPIMSFGKYQNKPLADIPSGYLRWALEEADLMTDVLRNNIASELENRRLAREKENTDPKSEP